MPMVAGAGGSDFRGFGKSDAWCARLEGEYRGFRAVRHTRYRVRGRRYAEFGAREQGDPEQRRGVEKGNGNRSTRRGAEEPRERGERLSGSSSSCRRIVPRHPQPQKKKIF